MGIQRQESELMNLTLAQLNDWLERYFHAWVSNEPDEVSALFAEEAVYYYGPFREPGLGREAIVRNWISNPEQQTDVTCEYEALATNSERGIAHWRVTFKPAALAQERVQLDGILVLRFNDRLECVEHREWYASQETPDDHAL